MQGMVGVTSTVISPENKSVEAAVAAGSSRGGNFIGKGVQIGTTRVRTNVEIPPAWSETMALRIYETSQGIFFTNARANKLINR